MSTSVLRRVGLSLLFGLLAAAPAVAGSLWIVDAAGGPGASFAEIQAAIDVAVSGDTILVRSGTYDPFVLDGKGLVIAADTDAEVLFFPVAASALSRVVNIPSDERAVLTGLGPAPGILLGAPVALEDNAGPVFIQDCDLRGENSSPFAPDSPALAARNCSAVTIVGSTLIGAGFGDDDTALYLESSTVALYDTELVPGAGGTGDVMCSPGLAGASSVIGSGALVELPGAARSYHMPGVVRTGGSVSVMFNGEIGDGVWWVLSASNGLTHDPVGLSGMFVLAAPLSVSYLGLLDGTGTLSFVGRVPGFPPGVLPLTVYQQAIFSHRTDGLVAATGRATLVLEGP